MGGVEDADAAIIVNASRRWLSSGRFVREICDGVDQGRCQLMSAIKIAWTSEGAGKSKMELVALMNKSLPPIGYKWQTPP